MDRQDGAAAADGNLPAAAAPSQRPASAPPLPAPRVPGHGRGAAARHAQQQQQQQQQPTRQTQQQQPAAADWELPGLASSGGSLSLLLGGGGGGADTPTQMEVVLAGLADPLGASAASVSSWSAGSSRGTSPLGSGSLGFMRRRTPQQQVLGRQASAPMSSGALACAGDAAAAGLRAPPPPQQQQQQLSLPASPTMLAFQGGAAPAAGVAGSARPLSSVSPSSASSWPDVDMEQAPACLGRGQSLLSATPSLLLHGGDSNGEAEPGLLWPSGSGQLQPASLPMNALPQPGLPLGLQLHMQQAGAAQPPAAGQQQQQAQQQQLLLQQLRQVQQQHVQEQATLLRHHQQQLQQLQPQLQGAQLMPPPLPHLPAPGALGSAAGPHAAAAAAAAAAAVAAAAVDGRPSAPRPPPLIIPSSSGPSSSQQPTATGYAAGPQLPERQAASSRPQQHGSMPTPSPALPRSSTSITPAMLSMGLADAPAAAAAAAAAAASAAGVATAATATAAAAAAAAAAGGTSSTGGSGHGSDSSGGGRMRRQRRRGCSVPASPALAAAPAGLCSMASSPATAAPAGMGVSAAAAAAAAGAQPLSGAADAAARMLACGRTHVRVVCGTLEGWLDVCDMMITLGSGTQDERRVSPPGFEALAGKGSTRKWRTSLTVVPDGPGDAWVAEAMPLGDFLRGFNLEHGAAGGLQAQHGQLQAQLQAQAQVHCQPPGGDDARPHSILSPPRLGVRAASATPLLSPPGSSYSHRRRRAVGDLGQRSQSLELDVDGSSEDQPPASAKRSRGSNATDAKSPWQPGGAWQQPPRSPAVLANPQLRQSPPPQQQQQLRQSPPPPPQQQQAQRPQAWPCDAAALAAVQQRAPDPAAVAAWPPDSGQPETQPCSQPEPQQGTGMEGLEHELPAMLSLTPPAALPGVHSQLSQPLSQQQPGGAGSAGQRQRPSPADTSPAVASSGTPQQQQQTDASDTGQAPLLSPAGRPIRQPSRRVAATSAAAAAAARLERFDRGSGPVGYAGGIRYLTVWCDQLRGSLDLSKMLVVPQEGQFKGQAMSLSAFEQLGGRGTARKWRRSLSVVDGGGEPISLGEWMERYQVRPGSEAALAAPSLAALAPPQARHISPKRRASTPPAAALASAAGAAPPRAGGAQQRGQRDQGGGSKAGAAQQAARRKAAAGGLPRVPSPPPAHYAQADAMRAAGAGWHSGAARPTTQVQQHAWRLQPLVTTQQAAAPPGRHAAAAGPVQQRAGLGQGGPDGPGSPQPPAPAPATAAAAAAAAGAAVEDPALNPELWMMLTEYACDPTHLELHLHPDQVELDMADAGRSPPAAAQQLLASPPGARQLAAAAGGLAPLGGGLPPGHAPGGVTGLAGGAAAPPHGCYQ